MEPARILILTAYFNPLLNVTLALTVRVINFRSIERKDDLTFLLYIRYEISDSSFLEL